MLSNSYLIFYDGSVCFITHTDVNTFGSLLAANIEPLPLDQVRLSDCTKTCPTADVLGPNIARKLSPEEQFQRVLQLRQDILSANKGLPTPLIVHGIDLNHLRPKCGVQWVGVYKTMPKFCDNNISALIHHNEVEVVTTPMPIAELPHATFSSTTSLITRQHMIYFCNSLLHH